MLTTDASSIIAIETATEVCSAALFDGNETHQCFDDTPRVHSQRLLSMVDELLKQASLEPSQLGSIAVSIGPGSFTGIRIAMAVAQGLAMAHALPIRPVSTLLLQAYQYCSAVDSLVDGSVLLSTIDARMGEVYAASYTLKDRRLTPLENEQLLQPQQLASIACDVAFGSGVDEYGTALSDKMMAKKIVSSIKPEAGALITACQQHGIAAMPATAIEANYIRNKVADTLAERQEKQANKTGA